MSFDACIGLETGRSFLATNCPSRGDAQRARSAKGARENFAERFPRLRQEQETSPAHRETNEPQGCQM